MIKLVSDTIDKNDVQGLVEWLSQEEIPRLTKGPLTQQLEAKWAEYIGTEHAVFVNSGSSALLLMLSALHQTNRLKNNKVVVPGLSWATDVSSPILLGLDPILCDCNLEDLSLDLEHLESIFKKEAPSAVILVSVLGLVPDMDRIQKLCTQYDVLLLEDVCESMGSKYQSQLLGSFGLCSVFSTYFGHHISTIEGGFINTSDAELYEAMLAIRSHGWDRDWNKSSQDSIREEWGINSFDAQYTFYYAGFNLRSTDLQASIGIKQIDKLASFSEKRHANFLVYVDSIQNSTLKISEKSGDFSSNFAFPIVSEDKKAIVSRLIENKIECRPLIAGSMSKQPFWIKQKGKTQLKNCESIHANGFYVPNHQDLTEKDIALICSLINA